MADEEKECFCCERAATSGSLCDRCYKLCHKTDAAYWVERIPSKSRSISANKTSTLGQSGWVEVLHEWPTSGNVKVKFQHSGEVHYAKACDLYTNPEEIEKELAFMLWIFGKNPNYWDKREARPDME